MKINKKCLKYFLDTKNFYQYYLYMDKVVFFLDTLTFKFLEHKAKFEVY